MSGKPAVVLEPITASLVEEVGAFLHAELNPRVSPADWAKAINPPWTIAQPNHGFMLRTGSQIVGTYIAFYSERVYSGQHVMICNLAAWCVLEDYRSHGLRLLRALLAQDGYHFTDLSPSGNVIPLNARLKFATLDTTTALVPNLPWPIMPKEFRLLTDPSTIESHLTDNDRRIYRDHAHARAAHHVVILRKEEVCYVIFRRDRRKNLRLFASILYVSNPALFSSAGPVFFRHLLLRHGIPVTLAELRIVRQRPLRSRILKRSRPKMLRSPYLQPDQIDYLYSELTCVPW